MVVSEVAELESVVKIAVASFLGTLSPITAQNLGITRERWFVRPRRRLHRVSR